MKKRALLVAIAAAVASPLAGSAQQDVSVTANAGWSSLYYYRGALQSPTSANAGMDVAVGDMFSAGTWGADVGDGSEIDLYAGLALPTGDQFSVSVGGTGYFYTGEAFDNTYLEANIGVGVGPLSVEWSFGMHNEDAPAGVTNPDDNSKYSFIGVTLEHEGLYATVGSFAGTGLDATGAGVSFSDAISDQFDKDKGSQYLEAGYGFSAADLDFTIAGIWADASLADDGNSYNELSLYFAISKTFEISSGM